MISFQIANFIEQSDDAFFFNNLENVQSIYHYSVPTVKLMYPEPFIASASFMHSDLWFVHILIYQYWLWFVFIFIIVFFFLTFLCTVRWCNMRVRPRRETRGVSRSKCGDLITATVPVSWATSIIVNESTDAIDYYDGFGTTELVVGIRAYQWGWEYYYPKDVDLSYNLKPNYSIFAGNSLKYSKTTDLNMNAANLWRFYQNKTFDHVVTPAHLLVIPIDNSKLVNFFNFSDAGANSAVEANSFKRIRAFSKAYTSSYFFTPDYFLPKFKQVASLYFNEGVFVDSYLFGVNRQHSFLTKSAVFNGYSTLFDLRSATKLLSHNLNVAHQPDARPSFNRFGRFFPKKNNLSVNGEFIKFYYALGDYAPASSSMLFFKSCYNNSLSWINDNTDKKQIKAAFSKLFIKDSTLFDLYDQAQIRNLWAVTDLSVSKTNGAVADYFSNTNKSHKRFILFSPNQVTPFTGRTIRNFLPTKPNVLPLNYANGSNLIAGYFDKALFKCAPNAAHVAALHSLKWPSLPSITRALPIRASFDYPYSPIASNSALINPLNYDSFKFTFNPSISNLLQGKEELTPGFLANSYWSFYWANSNPSWRLFNANAQSSRYSSFYLPIFSFYYDYDFRNWQSLELLEDSFWESCHSLYSHDKYLSLVKDFYGSQWFDKVDSLFNAGNKRSRSLKGVAYYPFLRKLPSRGFYFNAFYSDEYATRSNLTAFRDFFVFPAQTAFYSAEESFDSLSNLKRVFDFAATSALLLDASHPRAHSYALVLDSFRSDFDEFAWYFDDSRPSATTDALISDFFSLNQAYWLASSVDEVSQSGLRFTSSINLRNTAKNSIVNFNAIQKVFKTRFDEGRSHAHLSDLANSRASIAFLTAERTQYEKLLGKSKSNFYTTNLYKTGFKPLFNSLYDISGSTNFYFYDFPFLLAFKSDASRYLWFDWFAKWGYYEVQPSSSSRYAIHGMPYFSKNFEFSANITERLNETENYLTRISRARRNYLPNWTYAPYYFAKNNTWYKRNFFYDVMLHSGSALESSYAILGLMDWFWDAHSLDSARRDGSKWFFPSNSNINSYARAASKPQTSVQAYYYTITNLVDILAKREYLYRELLSSYNKLISLPVALTSSPKNPILVEFKGLFSFVDPIIYSSEYSRDGFFTSLEFFNSLTVRSVMGEFGAFLNLGAFSDYIFYYLLNDNLDNPLKVNSELFKNQYRPMRKGITNMIRLHATGAMALPIEIRLQVLASSKDVIHSWAIPSAGIKIDCVPGYSSHRVMIFLVSGIFWGQCMEICGRYHHWMPIVVYFMKRDLFFLWCTHFIFLTNANGMWSINDRQYLDYSRAASFDKSSWVTELNLR